MKSTVVVTTYNRPDALAAVLAGLAAQCAPDFEIIVADDGSGPETKAVIDRWASRIALRHVWQDDAGFRAGRARNLAVSKATGDYLIFIDGDCVVRPGFVAAHARLAEPGYFVAGNRVLLSEDFTARALSGQMPLHTLTTGDWRARERSSDINRFSPLITVPGQFWRKWQPSRWQGARTCNLGIWKTNFVAVNGFDEAYAGWGHEDADLAVRLIRSGVRRKDGRFATAVLHLWHRENDRSQLPENQRRLAEIISGDRIRAERGLADHFGQISGD